MAEGFGIDVKHVVVEEVAIQGRRLLELYAMVLTIGVTIPYDDTPQQFRSNNTGLDTYYQGVGEQYVASGNASAVFKAHLIEANVSFYEGMAITAVDFSPTMAPVEADTFATTEASTFFRVGNLWFVVSLIVIPALSLLCLMFFVYRTYLAKVKKDKAKDKSEGTIDNEIEFGWADHIIFGVGDEEFSTASYFPWMRRTLDSQDDGFGEGPNVDQLNLGVGYDSCDEGGFDAIYGGGDDGPSDLWSSPLDTIRRAAPVYDRSRGACVNPISHVSAPSTPTAEEEPDPTDFGDFGNIYGGGGDEVLSYSAMGHVHVHVNPTAALTKNRSFSLNPMNILKGSTSVADKEIVGNFSSSSSNEGDIYNVYEKYGSDFGVSLSGVKAESTSTNINPMSSNPMRGVKDSPELSFDIFESYGMYGGDYGVFGDMTPTSFR